LYLPSFPTRRSSDLAWRASKKALWRTSTPRFASPREGEKEEALLREALTFTGRSPLEPRGSHALPARKESLDERPRWAARRRERSEEHTSELQSREN